MTDKDTSRAHKRTYNKISDVQRSKLQEYYDGGMKTCGSDNTEKIGVAAEETGLTIDQVKVRYFFSWTETLPCFIYVEYPATYLHLIE